MEIEAGGFTQFAQYTVWLHTGSVQQPSASAAFLGYLDADGNGQASPKTASAQAGAVGLHIDLSPELIGDGPAYGRGAAAVQVIRSSSE